MRADEGVDIAKMAVNCFLALIVLSAVIGLLALSQRLWNVFSREQTQNKINQEYAEVAAYDNNVVTGQDLVSMFMGSKGKMPVYIGANPSQIHSRDTAVTDMPKFRDLNNAGGIIGLRGYMGDFHLVDYNDQLFNNGVYFYCYGTADGEIFKVQAKDNMKIYLGVTDSTVDNEDPLEGVGLSGKKPKSLNYNELGNAVRNGTLLPKAQQYIKDEYKAIAKGSAETFPGTSITYDSIKDVTNETYGYWYSVVIFEDEQCTRPCGIYVEPVYYKPPETP